MYIESYFFQFKEYLVVITTKDDPFVDDGTNLYPTDLYTDKGVYGTCGAAFHGRIFIADGNTLYWTAANTYNDWTTANDAGYKDDFVSDIVDMKVFGSYLVIWTKSDVYYLSGYDPTDFRFDQWGKMGVFSKYANCEFDNNIYTFTNGGLYPLEVTGDMAQVRFVQALSDKIAPLLEEVDQDRLNEVMVVPYEKRKQIWVYLPIKGKPGIYKAYILNMMNKADSGSPLAWYTREGKPITHAIQYNGEIYSATSDGKIYKEDFGDTFDGDTIESEIWFEPLSFNSARVKNCDEFKTFWDAQYNNKCKIGLKYNGKADNIKYRDIDLSSKKKTVTDILSKTIPLKGEFSSIQFGIITDAADEDYMFYGGTFINLKETGEY